MPLKAVDGRTLWCGHDGAEAGSLLLRHAAPPRILDVEIFGRVLGRLKSGRTSELTAPLWQGEGLPIAYAASSGEQRRQNLRFVGLQFAMTLMKKLR